MTPVRRQLARARRPTGRQAFNLRPFLAARSAGSAAVAGESDNLQLVFCHNSVGYAEGPHLGIVRIL